MFSDHALNNINNEMKVEDRACRPVDYCCNKHNPVLCFLRLSNPTVLPHHAHVIDIMSGGDFIIILKPSTHNIGIPLTSVYITAGSLL